MKRSQKKNATGKSVSRKNRTVGAITLILILAFVSTILAQVITRKRAKGKVDSVSIAALGASSPSKEYIYAGGRLVATEETVQGCDPSNPTGDTDVDGIPNGVEPGENKNPCLKDNDIFNNARLFVMQQYRDFLGREGDSGGISFWTNQLNAGTATRAQVIDAFFNSAEFQGTVSPVTRLYFAYFLRIPDYEGLLFWVNSYRQGSTLDSISQAFAASSEFQTRYGSLNNTQFVTLVYQNVLGRAPDSGGLEFWVAQLDSGATRGSVMGGFSESAEYQQKSFTKVYVTMMYVGMLRRAPEPGGFDNWVNAMNSGTSGLAIIQGFLGSAEYHNRFLA